MFLYLELRFQKYPINISTSRIAIISYFNVQLLTTIVSFSLTLSLLFVFLYILFLLFPFSSSLASNIKSFHSFPFLCPSCLDRPSSHSPLDYFLTPIKINSDEKISRMYTMIIKTNDYITIYTIASIVNFWHALQGRQDRTILNWMWSSIEFRAISISTSGRDPRKCQGTYWNKEGREWTRVRDKEEEKESAKKIEEKGTRKAISYLGKSSPVSSLWSTFAPCSSNNLTKSK